MTNVAHGNCTYVIRVRLKLFTKEVMYFFYVYNFVLLIMVYVLLECLCLKTRYSVIIGNQ